jgi:uncharacterized protein YuzE
MAVKITFDKEADAAYIYLKEMSPGEVKKTISLNDSLNIDLDSNNQILGIEILNASQNLPLSSINKEEVTNI